ncbi:molybdopterin-dependent oxidoreductase [Chloroflexota bacterium]
MISESGKAMKVTGEQGEKIIRTGCPLMCSRVCALLAHVKDGVLVKVEPAEMLEEKHRKICALGLSAPKLVYHPDRLKYPMKRVGERGGGKWQRISWDEALDTIAGKLKEIADKYGSDSVAWTVIQMALLQTAYWRLADVWGGTIISVIGYGDSAGPCGDKVSYGTRGLPGGRSLTASFQEPRLLVSWGENSAETVFEQFLAIADARERGGKSVVIDPRFTPTAAKADEWIPIRPGTDAALALGMINVIVGRGLEDGDFITESTVGPFLVRSDNGLFLRAREVSSMSPGEDYVVWDSGTDRPQPHHSPGLLPALRGSYTIDGIECKPAFQLLVELAEQYSLEKTSELTGVAPEVIERLALDYVRLKPVNSYRGMGAQRAFYGDLSWRAITALAAVTGNISPTPTNEFVPNLPAFAFPKQRARMLPLMDMLEAILTDKPHPIKAIWLARHNMVNQIPNANKMVTELFPRLDLIVVAEIFMTATAEYADIVLPVCTYLECTELPTVTSILFAKHLQLQQKVIEPLYESKSDFQIAKELARRMGVGEYFEEGEEEYIELMLSSEHPSMQGVTLEKIREGRVKLLPYTRPLFRTPSRRIEFYSEDRRLKELGESLPVFKEPPEGARQALARKYPLCLLTTHSKYRIHSMYANIDWVREVEPEPVLEMNPVDAAGRDIRDGEMVIAFNDRGMVKVKAMVHEGIMPGVVNITQGWWHKHFAEGSHNALTRDEINPAQQAVYEANAPHFDVLVEVKRAEG